MKIRVFDLDGSVTAQPGLVHDFGATVIPLQDWGPDIRICCSFSRFRQFERVCVERDPDASADPAITFCGSGDFHHVTMALLRRQREPFNLLMLDKHPDWVRGAPIMHCGTWLSHALRLPNLRRMFHLGGDLDFDNWLRPFAPWQSLRSGRVTVLSAVRRFCRGMWRDVPNEPLRVDSGRAMPGNRLDELCASFRADLAKVPLYVTIDKDLMTTSDALVNWDSGHLTLDEVRHILRWFVTAAGGRVAGVDVVGDWSPCLTRGMLRGILHLTEHPALRIHPENAALVNGTANRALIEAIASAIR